jgi:hypothetical protein
MHIRVTQPASYWDGLFSLAFGDKAIFASEYAHTVRGIIS